MRAGWAAWMVVLGGCEGAAESENGSTICLDAPWPVDQPADLEAGVAMDVHARGTYGCRMRDLEVSCDAVRVGADLLVTTRESWSTGPCEGTGGEVRATCPVEPLPEGDYRLVIGTQWRSFSVPGPGGVCISAPTLE